MKRRTFLATAAAVAAAPRLALAQGVTLAQIKARGEL